MNSRRFLARHLEKGLLIVGLFLLAIYGVARLHSEISARLAVRKFKAERIKKRVRAQESAQLRTGEQVDFTLWSDKRVQAYMDSLVARAAAPSAVLHIPKLRLEVPVYDGTDELALNRGVGRIIGTARLGQIGNTGIAGHRDGFFRGLKDIAPGDTIELTMSDRAEHYVVENIKITSPEDVSVLQPTNTSCLTLVTCYPFYFVGSAPQRYIVKASRVDPDRPLIGTASVGNPSFTQTKRRE